MLKKFYVLCFMFLCSIETFKIIPLSEFLFFFSSNELLSEKKHLECLKNFVEDNVEIKKELKTKEEIINDYILSCLLEYEILPKREFSRQKINTKLDFLINRLFFYSSKLLLESNYILNLNEIKLYYDFDYLSYLLNHILDYVKKNDEYFFLNNLITDIIDKKNSLIDFFKNINIQNDKLEFNDILNKFLGDVFCFSKKYFCTYFNEILPFLSLKDQKFFFITDLRFLEINVNENVNIDVFKKYSDYFSQLNDPLIFIEFYVKHIKYFLNNLIFLSILKKNTSHLSEVNEVFYNKTFYENLQNFFNSSCLSFCAVGQYIQCFNLNEFLSIRKTGNFFNYKNDLTFSDVEDFSGFFLKLVEIYDKNISILNFNKFDIDNFINFITKLNGKIKFPKEIINIINFIFSYDSYHSSFYINEEKFLYNDEKKKEFDIDESLQNTNEFNSDILNKHDYSMEKDQKSYKKIEKILYKSLNFEHNVFFRFKLISFDFLKKDCYLGIGYKVNKEQIFLGVNLFFDFSFLNFSIAYFFKYNFVLSGFIQIYKIFFLSFALSSNKKISFGISFFLNVKDVSLDFNFNFYF